MRHLSELEEAEMRQEMRAMYRKIGFFGSLQCLYEMILGVNILIEVIKEEHANENRGSK